MGDLLIRNISDAVKADLVEIASRKGGSISETSKRALLCGIDALKKLDEEKAATRMGSRLKGIFAGVVDTEDEAEQFRLILDEVRRGPERPLPDFK